MMLAPRAKWLPHRLWIDRIFSVDAAGIAAVDRGRDFSFEFGKRRAGQRVDLPGLQIAARRRARRSHDQIAHQRRVDRLIEKPAAGHPGVDGFEYVHGERSWGSLIESKVEF